MENNELYYLQDSRNYSGNDLLWWCPASVLVEVD